MVDMVTFSLACRNKIAVQPKIRNNEIHSNADPENAITPI
jgi:hypothetical protein